MKKPRVLIYGSSFHPVSHTFIKRQVEAVKEKYDVLLVCHKKEDYAEDDPIIELGPNTLGPWDRLLRKFRLIFTGVARNLSLAYTKKLKQVLDDEEAVLVHIHFGHNGVALWHLLKNKTPFIVSFHGVDASQMTRNPQYMQQLRHVFREAKGVIICSEHMRESLKLSQWKGKVHFIPYGVDTDLYSPTANDQKPKESLIVLHAGRIAEKKGVPDLIRVWKEVIREVPNGILQIVGDGEELETSKALVAELTLEESVVFYGKRTPEEVRAFMSDCDIFVLNSRTSAKGDMEGLPNTLLESMSMEKAVISTRHAGIPSLIQNEVNGMLVEPKDNQQLKSALLGLLKDVDLRTKLGKQGRSTVRQDFSIEVMKKRLEDAYERCLN